MLEVILHGKSKRTRRSSQPFAEFPALNTAQHAVLRAWLKGQAREPYWQSLLDAAGVEHLDTALELLQLLLDAGAVAVKEEKAHSLWRPWRVLWLDLEALQRAVGMATRAEQQADKSRWAAQLRALALENDWLEGAVQSCLKAKLSASVQAARAELLTALVQWKLEERQGLRQDFELAARHKTKAISPTEWTWLEQHVALESLGITRFEQLLLVGGSLSLQNTHSGSQWDCDTTAFAALPCRKLAAPLAVRKTPARYWLIENRASFERQAQQLDDGVCVVWLPGRPGQDWQNAVRWLLAQAPAPATMSCDPDPAGIQIALTAGALWMDAGVAWHVSHMAPSDWQTGKTLPLNDYDRRVLAELQTNATLSPDLASLRDYLLASGTKAEQEGWL